MRESQPPVTQAIVVLNRTMTKYPWCVWTDFSIDLHFPHVELTSHGVIRSMAACLLPWSLLAVAGWLVPFYPSVEKSRCLMVPTDTCRGQLFPPPPPVPKGPSALVSDKHWTPTKLWFGDRSAPSVCALGGFSQVGFPLQVLALHKVWEA